LKESKASGRLSPGEVRETHDGATAICNEVKESTSRKGYEKLLLPGVKAGLEGWHRAHSQGAGLGNEMKEGIVYAPGKVNQGLQNHGIEKYIRDIRDQLSSDAKLLLTTETKAHSDLRLEYINYKLEAESNDQRTRLFEASIEVENKLNDPKISISAHSYTDNIERFLK
jgi:hypothetical protein